MSLKRKIVGKVVKVVVAVAVLSWVVMLLWNAVAPALFGNAQAIDYPHAMGLLLLSRILFGGFRGHHGHHGRRPWKYWRGMTAQEREQFLRRGPACRESADAE